VLFAITLGETGGAQEHIRQLTRGLLDRGHEVGVLVQDPSDLATAARDLGAGVLPWQRITRNPNPRADLAARHELRRAVASFTPDVLHLHSAKAGVLGRGLLRRPEGVTIYTCHHPAYGPGRKLSHRITARPIEQATLRWVDGIITVGARDMPMLRKLAPRVPITLIRNGVDPDGPPRSPKHPVPGALWVARMAHPKDPLLAITVWERVVREIPEATLSLCGTGPMARDLEHRIAASPARHRISYHGYVPDISPYQSEASLFLLMTSIEGGITMATLEALSQGLVPIVSDAGDAFLLAHAGCGIVTARGDDRGTAAAIVALLRDPDRLVRMRDRALWFAREDWTAAEMVAATEDWYVSVRDQVS